jgi:hypothetical protein
VNFAAFQLWREKQLRENPRLLDCAETNLYRSLEGMQPKFSDGQALRQIHRCDLARLWLNRYGFPEILSRHALVCRGVRHALSIIFNELARKEAVLLMPGDVYPVYAELAQAAGNGPRLFSTLPEAKIPSDGGTDRTEYLLIANPWKPLGRFLTNQECAALETWLAAAPNRYLLVDCVYDLGAPFHGTTQKLFRTGRAILLHSITKGWLRPKIFGIALFGKTHPQLEVAFRNDPPAPEQLRMANKFLTDDANLPCLVVDELFNRKRKLLASLPEAVTREFPLDPADTAPGCYFFPVRVEAGELLQRHGLIAIPASAFGSVWSGSILTSLSGNFAGNGKETLS